MRRKNESSKIQNLLITKPKRWFAKNSSSNLEVNTNIGSQSPTKRSNFLPLSPNSNTRSRLKQSLGK